MAKKKIYDVVPPKEAHKLENTIQDLSAAKKKRRKAPAKVSTPSAAKSSPVSPAPTPTPTPPTIEAPVLPAMRSSQPPVVKRRFPTRELVIGGIVIVVILGVYFALKLPKAIVTVQPKLHELVLDEKITATTEANVVDLSNNIIPARYIEKEDSDTQEFPATGQADNDGKAKGTITVYNKTGTSFSLIKGTHFLSDSGKYFVTTEKIIIPGGSKNSPGSIVVHVQAENIGSDSNIGPSTFSIPKLYGTSYYYSVYADSKEAMSGGYSGKVKKVTDSDIQTAKEVLTKKLLARVEATLMNELSADYIIVDGATNSTVIEDTSDVKADTIADVFHETARVKATAIVFLKTDLKKFIDGTIASQITGDDDSLEKNQSVKIVLDSMSLKDQTLSANLHIIGQTYQHIETQELIDLFSRKSAEQIQQTVDQHYPGEVTNVKVNFWPFWVHKAPKDKQRIKVNLTFD